MAEEKKAQAQADVQRPTWINKITMKELDGKKSNLQELLIKQKDKDVPIAHVYGYITQATDEKSDLGPYIKFHGQFRAVSLISGRKLQSGELILPGPAQSVLNGMVLSAQVGGQIGFGVTITARYNETAATSYVFGAQPFMDAQDDPLSEFEKLLPAPKK